MKMIMRNEKRKKRSEQELQDDDMENDAEDDILNGQLGRLNTKLIQVLNSIKVDAADICSPPRF